MLGHRLVRSLGEPFDVWSTERSGAGGRDRVWGDLDVRICGAVESALDAVAPDAVINCIGIVKQRPEAQDPEVCSEINALFPHRLAGLCGRRGIRLVHISTDCVFSGAKGGYVESDEPDADDLYGRSKAIGEVDYPHAVTLRTSIIGPELGHGLGLVAWFLRQDAPVRGYTHARFSGLSTHELTRVVSRVLLDHPGMRGVWHVSGDPIDKCSLLLMLREAFGRSTPIIPCGALRIDRTLDRTRFQTATGYRPPPWDAMVREMALDGQPTPMEALIDSYR